MLFSRKCNIRVAHRFPPPPNNILKLKRWIFLLFEVDMTFTLNDNNLQTTLTFEQALVDKYVVQFMYVVNYKISFI